MRRGELLFKFQRDNFIRSNDGIVLTMLKDLKSCGEKLSTQLESWSFKRNFLPFRLTSFDRIFNSDIGLTSLDLSESGIEALNPVTRFVKLEED